MKRDARLEQCPECGRLAVNTQTVLRGHGGRFVAFVPRLEPLDAEPIENLEAELAGLEPWLRKIDWYPMTNMISPSALQAADVLAYRLDAGWDPDRERIEVAKCHLRALRAGFRRILS